MDPEHFYEAMAEAMGERIQELQSGAYQAWPPSPASTVKGDKGAPGMGGKGVGVPGMGGKGVGVPGMGGKGVGVPGMGGKGVGVPGMGGKGAPWLGETGAPEAEAEEKGAVAKGAKGAAGMGEEEKKEGTGEEPKEEKDSQKCMAKSANEASLAAAAAMAAADANAPPPPPCRQTTGQALPQQLMPPQPQQLLLPQPQQLLLPQPQLTLEWPQEEEALPQLPLQQIGQIGEDKDGMSRTGGQAGLQCHNTVFGLGSNLG